MTGKDLYEWSLLKEAKLHVAPRFEKLKLADRKYWYGLARMIEFKIRIKAKQKGETK